MPRMHGQAACALVTAGQAPRPLPAPALGTLRPSGHLRVTVLFFPSQEASEWLA